MPKVIKIPLIILAVILALALVFLAIAQTSWFKNYLTDELTEYLGKALGTEVSIDEVSLSYFDRFNASNVIMKDQHGHDMFDIENLEVNYDLMEILDGVISIDKVLINNANVHIGVHEGERALNLQHLIDYFTPPRDTTKTRAVQKTEFKKIELVNSSFHFFDKNLTPPTDRDFDETNFLFSEITGTLDNFVVINDSISFETRNLSAIEKSGLIINSFKSTAIISPRLFHFADLELKTEHSTLKNSLIFRQTSYQDFSNFIEDVEIESELDNSTIHSKDLAYFSDILKSYNETITINGTITGTVDDLRSKSLKMNISDHTYFDGSSRIVGIPDTERMVMDINSRNLTTSSSAISRLANQDDLPDEFLRLGKLGYVGKFKGTISDFNVDGIIRTAHGEIDANVAMKNPTSSNPEYEGTVVSEGLNLGELLEIPELGSSSFNLNIIGSGFDPEHLNASIIGEVNSLEYDNYLYQNVTINGVLIENGYSGEFAINEPNYSLNFDGDIRDENGKYVADIKTNVATLNLKTLGLDTVNSILTFNGKIDAKGSNIDDFVGTIKLASIKVKRLSKEYNLKDVLLTSSMKKQREIHFESDLANLSLTGDFLPSEIESIFSQILYVIDPLQYEKSTDTLESSLFHLAMEASNRHPLVADLFPGMDYDSVDLDLTYEAGISKINGTVNLKNFSYDKVGSPTLQLTFGNNSLETPINYNLKTDGLFNSDSVIFEELNLHGFIKNGLINFETLANQDTTIGIELIGHAVYQNDSLKVYLDDSKIEIFEEEWTLRNDDDPRLVYFDGVTELSRIDLRKDGQILFFQGTTGKVTKMNLNMLDFSLENLNPFLSGYGLKLAGMTNGTVDILDRDGFPIIETDEDGVIIENLMLDSDTLGNVVLKSSPSEDLLKVLIEGDVTEGLLNDMQLRGEINFNDEESPLDLHLLTRNSSVKPFEKVLVGLISNVDGVSNTDIRISGPLDKPILNGRIALDSLDFVLDYMQTRYTAEAVIDVDASAFTINNATLFDRNGSAAVARGNVTHRNFANFLFNLSINDLKNFEIMNTSKKDNELFYGTAFVDGNIKILGEVDDIMLQINAKSRPNTNISIPLDYFEAGGNLSYVSFVDMDNDPNSVIDNFKAAAGVSMDFNFEVTNDANIVLVFDELLGDKIEATTHGNLRMEVNTYGDFNMYGGLTIDKGNYLFTAYDIISKYFIVEPGGTLRWDGNPYNATIDLDAVKREYPYPNALVAGTGSSEDYIDPLPTDVHLLLKGLLFNPEVTFDLTFPGQTSLGTTNTTLSTVIDRVKADQEEVDRQVFALLALGSFIPPSFSNTTGSGYEANGVASTGWNSISDFASSQLNNMLSQFDLPFQVGVDWQKNASDLEQDELIASLKYKIARWEFSGSIDALADAGHTPYDISIEYKLKEDGNIRMKGFVKNANDPTLGNLQTTTGLGLFYRYQFDRLFKRNKKK